MSLIIQQNIKPLPNNIMTISEKLHYFRSTNYPGKMKGEALLSCQIANYLREMSLTGQLKCVWTKISNETPSKSLLYGLKQRAMGKLSGVPDYICTFPEGHLWVELKHPTLKSKLSEGQKFFREWCSQTSCNYHVIKSLEEMVQLLKAHKLITTDVS